MIHPPLILQDESLLHPVSPDAGCPLNALLEMGVYWRMADGLKTLELSRSGDVETLVCDNLHEGYRNVKCYIHSDVLQY